MPEIIADVSLSFSTVSRISSDTDTVISTTLELHVTETIRAETEGPVTALEV